VGGPLALGMAPIKANCCFYDRQRASGDG
jgi:hypothetical protein